MICPSFRVGDDEVVRTIAMVAWVDPVAEVTLDELRIQLMYPLDDAADRFFSRAEYNTVAARAAANEASRRAATDGDAATGTRKPRAEHLYRGLLRCGICELRMTGNIRRRSGSRYYFCYPHKTRPAKIPPEHPPTIYLAEAPLHEAVTEWLSHALFGPDRVTYWRECLTASQGQGHSRRAPAGARLAEINSDIADLTRRLRREVLNLEAEDITPAARRQITTRMAELEATLTRRQADADQARAELNSLSPDIDETTEALTRLPQLADGLADLPQGDLRRPL